MDPYPSIMVAVKDKGLWLLLPASRRARVCMCAHESESERDITCKIGNRAAVLAG